MILEIRDLETYYGSSHVLFGLSLDVAEGEVVCLLGRNGVGKTTTLRSVMGLTPPRSGSIKLKGREICGQAPYRIAAQGLSFVPAERKIVPDLSVHDNLVLGERRWSAGRWTTDRVYELFPDLVALKDRPGGTLSGGQQQMLTIGRTLMCAPEVLLLDEPAEGLAPVVVNKLRDQLKLLVSQGMTILLAEQNLGFALSLADRAYIIENGTVKYEGSIEDLSRDDEVKRRYLAV